MTTRRSQLLWGFGFGIIFGFLLQKGGVTEYDVIIGQLLLEDFTVLKVMLSAVVVGSIGLHIMRHRGWVAFSPKRGSWGQNVIGGLIFGLGFATLGYCPGTIVGAIGNGYLDAATAGLVGILLGSALLAAIYPKIVSRPLSFGDYGAVTLPELLKVNAWVILIPLNALIVVFLYLLERAGL